MARRRMLDPSFWDDDNVGALSTPARLLFLACISNADDYGKLKGAPATLKKIAFGFTNDSVDQVRAWRDEIAENVRGFHVYAVDGKEYIALLHWHRFQRVDHPQASTLPDPPDIVFSPSEYQKNTKRDSQNKSQNDSENPARQLGEGRESSQSSQSSQSKEPAPPGCPASILTTYEKLFWPLGMANNIRQDAVKSISELCKHPNYENKPINLVRGLCVFHAERFPAYSEKNGKPPRMSYIAPFLTEALDAKAIPHNGTWHAEDYADYLEEVGE